MPQDRSAPSVNTVTVSTVEHSRLLALVDTQRKHIKELNQQLEETLEVKKQQQLQLVQQSPARRNVRQMLSKAAADNSLLAKKVEELRAQRNALAVTKAALTAQMSELIRGAADDAQRDSQYRMLLDQLQQLCSFIGEQQLHDPAEQMAAVISYVRKASQEQHILQAELDTYKQAAGQSKQASTAAAAAVTDASVALSPTGHQLDQTATSQLIWDRKCPDLFQAADTAVTTPAATTYAGSACSGYRTARSCFTDLSDISPLRGSGTGALQRTPPLAACCTHTPIAASGSSGSSTAAGGAGQSDDGEDSGYLGSPLSCQSLSMFSSSKAEATPGSALNPRCLQLDATPVSKDMPQAADGASSSKSETCTTPAALAHSLDQALLRDQQGSSCSSFRFPGLAATPAAGQQQQQPESPEPLSMMMSPVSVFGVKPEDLQCPPSTSNGKGWSAAAPGGPGAAAAAAAASSNRRAVGLSLESEFRLAACDSLWPGPAVPAASPAPTRVLALDAGSAWHGGGQLYIEDDDAQDEQQQQPVRQPPRSDRRRWLVASLCVVAPLTVAAAAGGAAAWHFKREELLDVMGAVKQGMAVAAQYTQKGAVVGWRHCQQGATAAWARAQQVAHRGHGTSSSTGDGGKRGGGSEQGVVDDQHQPAACS